MKELIEKTLQTAAALREQIEKIRDNYQVTNKEFDMADDAVLGAGWAVKRLQDLKELVCSQPGESTQS
jgi:hypothetical protein